MAPAAGPAEASSATAAQEPKQRTTPRKKALAREGTLVSSTPRAASSKRIAASSSLSLSASSPSVYTPEVQQDLSPNDPGAALRAAESRSARRERLRVLEHEASSVQGSPRAHCSSSVSQRSGNSTLGVHSSVASSCFGTITLWDTHTAGRKKLSV